MAEGAGYSEVGGAGRRGRGKVGDAWEVAAGRAEREMKAFYGFEFPLKTLLMKDLLRCLRAVRGAGCGTRIHVWCGRAVKHQLRRLDCRRAFGLQRYAQ